MQPQATDSASTWTVDGKLTATAKGMNLTFIAPVVVVKEGQSIAQLDAADVKKGNDKWIHAIVLLLQLSLDLFLGSGTMLLNQLFSFMMIHNEFSIRSR